MPVISADASSPRVVVVNKTAAVGSVSSVNSAIKIPDQGAAVGRTTDSVSIVNVSSPGPQGAPGLAGGSSLPRVASSVLGGHRLVRSIDENSVAYADVTNPTHGDDTLGLTLGAAGVGEAVNVQRAGAVEFNGWNWEPGDLVFLGFNGLPTQVVPEPVDGAAFLQPIGYAESPTVLHLSIDPPIYFED